jgi:hypothetical protein
MTASQKTTSLARKIDGRIKELGDWRGQLLARLRGVIKQADLEVVEEWKWRRIDFHKGDEVDEKALEALIRAAMALNTRPGGVSE